MYYAFKKQHSTLKTNKNIKKKNKALGGKTTIRSPINNLCDFM